MSINRFALILVLLLVSSNAQAVFIRGDLNQDNSVDNADLLILRHDWLGLFKFRRIVGPPPPPVDTSALGCPDKADINDDGVVNFADYTYLENYLHNGGPAPLPPFQIASIFTAGLDPTTDQYGCGACFIAGNSGTDGWIKGFRPNNAYNFDSQSNWALYDVVTTAIQLKTVVEIAIVDSNTLAVLSIDTGGFSKISYVTLGGTGVINQVQTVLSGFDANTDGSLGTKARGLEVDGNGNFLVAEEAAENVANQLSFLNPMGGFVPSQTITNNTNLPYAVRISKLNPSIAFVYSRVHNFQWALKSLDLQNHTLTNYCENGNQLGFDLDLHIDRFTNVPFFIVDGSGSNEDLLDVCTPGLGFAIGSFDFGLSINFVAVDQFPTPDHDILIATRPSHIYRIKNTANYDEEPFNFTTGLPAGIVDVVCSEAD